MFNNKIGYKLEVLSQETKRLIGSTEQVVAISGEHVPKLEIVDVILMYCNVFSNNFQ